MLDRISWMLLGWGMTICNVIPHESKLWRLKYLFPRQGNILFTHSLRRFELQLVRLESVDPKELEVAYHFLDELKRQRGIDPSIEDKGRILDPILERFPPNLNVDKRIVRSWHYAFLEDLEREGEALDCSKTEYYEFYRRQDSLIGLSRGEEGWMNKCIRLAKLYETIKREGFVYRDLSRFICVMETPLSITRQGFQPNNSGYEIFSGHHRASVAAKLGVKKVTVAVLRDIRKNH